MKYFDLAGALGATVEIIGGEADDLAGTDHGAL